MRALTLAQSAGSRCACREERSAPAPPKRPAALQAPRHPAAQQTAVGLTVAAALLLAPPALADAPAPSSSSSSTLTITFAPPSVKASLDARDEATAYKCLQMFDCDGDRRDYAKKQWADFLERGGPERKRGSGSSGAAAAAPAAQAEAGSN